MGKYKILYHIVCLVVLSLYFRESQSRTLNDNESEHIITEKSGNIEDWKTECACFPITVKGTPVSKFLPFNDEHDRLVIYFYKNKKTNELSSYTPSWKKQINFPDLTFDTGDKLQAVPSDGIILFDTIKVPDRVKVMTAQNVVPVNDEYELSIPTSDTQPMNVNEALPKDLDQIAIAIPPEELAVYYPAPNSNHKIITDVNPSQDPNLSSLGNKQQPLNGTFFEHNQNQNQPLETQNQTPVISDSLISHLLPQKPRTERKIIIIHEPDQKPLVIQNQQIPDRLIPHIIPGILPGKPKKEYEKTITKSPEASQKLNKHQKKNLNSPLVRPNPLFNSMLHVSNNNLKVPMDASRGFRQLVKYLPGYEAILPPSKLHHLISPNWIDTGHPNKPNNLNKGYLPSQYENPTFNDWFNRQMINIRSQRPFMNVINYHVLKLLLIKALYDNGFYISENGDLLDSYGNILKMSNMQLHPIFLGDPMDYEKLISTKKCAIPYGLPYLEAILVTLIYPPRILAMIPLSLGNPFIFKAPGTLEHYRSSLPEKEKTTSDINDNVHKEDNDKASYIYEEESKGSAASVNEPKFSNNKESKNAYTYMGSYSNPTVDLSLQPNYNDQKSLLLTLSPNDSGISDGQMYDLIPEKTKKSCGGGKYCQINLSFRSGLPENEEQTSLERNFDVNKANGKIYDNINVTEKSDETIEENIDHMAANDDLPIKTNLVSKSGSPDHEIYGAKISNDFVPEGSETQPIFGKELNYLDEEGTIQDRISLEDFDDSQETSEKVNEEDYEMLHIKIVGGNPATSSGTPVNSRGRSGFDY